MQRNLKITTLTFLLFSFFFSILFTLQTRGVLLKAQGPTPTGIPVLPIFTSTNESKNSIQLRTFGYITIAPPRKEGDEGKDGGVSPLPDTEGNVEPTTSDCGKAEYKKYMNMLPGDRKGKNYGDPQCTFSKDKLMEVLTQKDPAQAKAWFCLADPESGYNPNAWLGASTSGAGAYGLYQMNPPEKGNGQYDNGYVVWTMQITNAIAYKAQKIKNSWSYWDSRSRAKCGI